MCKCPFFTSFVPELVQDNAASSSGSNLRSFFTGMGFLPSLVDKVIEENGMLCMNIDVVLLFLIGSGNG